MNRIMNFFLFCSGVYLPIIEECPTEKNKYIGIGASVFFTGLFASIAASFALFTIYQSYIIPIILGLIWGLMIFNLDRFIVSSIKKYDSFKMNLIGVAPRMILAIMLSIVIAKPLELKIFQQEINDELKIIQKERYQQQYDSLKKELSVSIKELNNEREQLKESFNVRLLKRDELVKAATEEADGTGGSGQKNLGPIYKVKEQNLTNYQDEFVKFQEEYEEDMRNLAVREDSLMTIFVVNESEILVPKAKGIAAQLHALNRLSNKSDSIWWTVFFITLLFIIVESTPIILKTLTPRGPYDELFDRTEKGYVAKKEKSL